ncbi:MAG: hypothetical protein DHS20C17_30810 [Cyclobacteriaceae bacterium]|nr:MAG: hypothetical protein DHS20C17_30810 [Cyclobacteriaceae bacterium]
MIAGACQRNQEVKVEEEDQTDYSIYSMDNLVAWCVVPFDSLQRGPQQRAEMLGDLGFKKFAYDWRDQHLPTFPEEVKALGNNGVELTAVWWWIDGQGDHLLNPGNQQLLHYLDSLNISCDIWMSFDDRFFEGLEDSQKLDKAVEAVKELNKKVEEIGCNLMLYNHGAWFGDPINQIEIIEKSGLENIQIVYNFHHAHQQMEEFPQLLTIMLPYLNTVNINGMKQEGPKILTVGAGDSESRMLRTLALSGFKGNIGIIGHLENEDVQIVLDRNLRGLQQIISNF